MLFLLFFDVIEYRVYPKSAGDGSEVKVLCSEISLFYVLLRKSWKVRAPTISFII